MTFGSISFDMTNYYGIKRIGGKGYENNYLIVRKKKRGEYAFFFFLLIFGGAVYLAADAIFRSLLFGDVRASLTLFF